MPCGHFCDSFGGIMGDNTMTQQRMEQIKLTMEIIRTICPVIMVILQIAIITGMVIIGAR
jgi:hypothetical protein